MSKYILEMARRGREKKLQDCRAWSGQKRWQTCGKKSRTFIASWATQKSSYLAQKENSSS
jgi:hypothetical protein